MTEFISKEPINKGWSGDKKYSVTDEQGNKFLLRVSPIEQYERKKSEYELMSQVAALGVPMCRPLEFGTCDEGVYSIQSWIDGDDAEEIMSAQSDTEQYVYGLEAGRILRKIHSIPAPETQEDWKIRFNRKMDYKIKKYGECPIKYENGQAFIDYINENRHLLKDRPQVYQHGDYHIGNMMIDRNGKLHIIDFNRNDYGDPYGVDISSKTIERAKENLADFKNVRLTCADFLSYEFGRAFDVVYSSLTFMHIEDKQRAVNKIAGLLNDAGRFVLSIDKNPSEFIDTGTRKIKIFPDTLVEIAECIRTAGLTILNQYDTEFATIFVAQKG